MDQAQAVDQTQEAKTQKLADILLAKQTETKLNELIRQLIELKGREYVVEMLADLPLLF